MKISRGDYFCVTSRGVESTYSTTDPEVRRIQLQAGTILRARVFKRAGRPNFTIICDVVTGRSSGRRVKFNVQRGYEATSLDIMGLRPLSALEALAMEGR